MAAAGPITILSSSPQTLPPPSAQPHASRVDLASPSHPRIRSPSHSARKQYRNNGPSIMPLSPASVTTSLRDAGHDAFQSSQRAIHVSARCDGTSRMIRSMEHERQSMDNALKRPTTEMAIGEQIRGFHETAAIGRDTSGSRNTLDQDTKSTTEALTRDMPTGPSESIDGVNEEREISPHFGKTTGKRKRATKGAADISEVATKPRKRAVAPKKNVENENGVTVEVDAMTAEAQAPAPKKRVRKPKQPAEEAEGEGGAADGTKPKKSRARKTNSKTAKEGTSAEAALPTARALVDTLKDPYDGGTELDAEDVPEGDAATAALSTLIGGFEYQHAALSKEAPKDKTEVTTAAPTRKMQLEAVSGLAGVKATTKKPRAKKAPTVKPPKEKIVRVKSPKKRPLTITDLATAAYRPPVLEEAPTIRPLTEFLLAPTQPSNALPQDVTVPKKAAKTKKTKAGATKTTYVLPSPRDAQRRMQGQDFLFGTSSQLARDESPTVVRSTQQAISESEQFMDASQSYSPTTSRVKIPTAPHGTTFEQGRNDLWCQAARDEAQATFACQELAPPPASSPILPIELVRPDESVVVDAEVRAEPRSVGRHVQAEDFIITVDSSSPPSEHRTDSGFVDISDLEAIPSPEKKTVERSALQSLDANAKQPKPSVDSAPAKKPRGRPRKESTVIAPKDRLVQSPRAAENIRPMTPKKRKTTKRASAKADHETDWLNIDEIADSEAELLSTPSPTRRRSSPPQSPPKTLELYPAPSANIATHASINPDAETSMIAADPLPKNDKDPAWPAMAAELFAQIRSTIVAQPRSTNHARPSWYEKILMYDPIVLEDLTAWLNEGGLGRKYAVAKMVETTTGKASKKPKKKTGLDDGGGGGVPEAVVESHVRLVREVGLKPWMVQKFCEEYSICCLWKEGLRGGVKSKY